MANTPTIIDAVSSEVPKPVAEQMASVMQNIPVKIDASQMQTVLQALASQTAAGQIPGATEKINPSTFIKSTAQDMEALYARFDKLKILAAELNGLPISNPLPPSVSLKNIVINFSLTKDGKTEEHAAEIYNVASIADITGLMSSEFGMIISALHNHSQQVEDLAKRTTERCAAALKDWEEKNKDKQIVRVNENGEGVSTSTVANESLQLPAEPPTLATS